MQGRPKQGDKMARMRVFSRSSKFFHDLTLINEVLMEPTGRTFAVCCIKDLALHKFRLHSPVRTSEKCMNKDSIQAFFGYWHVGHEWQVLHKDGILSGPYITRKC